MKWSVSPITSCLQVEDKNPQRMKRAMGSDDASGSSTPSKRRRNGGDVCMVVQVKGGGGLLVACKTFVGNGVLREVLRHILN